VYPIGRTLDPNNPDDAAMVAYWLDMRNQIHGEVGQFDWSTVVPQQTQAQAGGSDTHADAAPEGAGDWEVNPAPQLEDQKIAEGIFWFEYAILEHWEAALQNFDKVLMSASDDEASPDFAGKMLTLFFDKALGEVVKKATDKIPGLDIAVDALKGLWDEAERAKAADKSVRLRDFYTEHMTHIDNLKREVVSARDRFWLEIRDKLAKLLETDIDGYGLARDWILSLYVDAEHRHNHATPEALFADLSAEWVGGNKSEYGNPGNLHIRIFEADLSVIDVKADAPDGEKIVDYLAKQPGGMDFWNMDVLKIIAYLDADEHLKGWVRVDASGRLANLPQEDAGNYKQVYQRILDAGGLAPYHK
jgi:hypothetical protein